MIRAYIPQSSDDGPVVFIETHSRGLLWAYESTGNVEHDWAVVSNTIAMLLSLKLEVQESSELKTWLATHKPGI